LRNIVRFDQGGAGVVIRSANNGGATAQAFSLLLANAAGRLYLGSASVLHVLRFAAALRPKKSICVL
jgi:hypothetical protein